MQMHTIVHPGSQPAAASPDRQPGAAHAVLLGGLSFLGAATLSALAVLYVPGDWFGVQAVGEPGVHQRLVAPAVGETEGKARAQANCSGCGIVESIARIEGGSKLAPTFLFTVRLRDGTRRTSVGTEAGGWRKGDPIMLIGGQSPAATSP